MKPFVLNLGGYTPPRVSARQLRTLFHQGVIERNTRCRHRKATVWSTIDEIFPMLKYEERRFGVVLSRKQTGPIRRSAAKLLTVPSLSELLHFLGRPGSPV